MLNGISTDAEFSRPLGDRQAFAIPFDESGQSSVSVLLDVIGPSAILRTVTLGILDAIDRVLWRWSRTHVSEEVLESTPSVRNGKAFCAVSLKQQTVRITAALNDMRPDVVLLRVPHSVCFGRGDYGLAIRAATRFLSGVQSIAPGNYRFAARAQAFPERLLRCVRSVGAFNHGQLTVCMAGPVYNWASHTDKSIMER
jgi:hypothetical protein